jgi:hypothetical protein
VASDFESTFLEGFRPATTAEALRVSCATVTVGGGVYVVLSPDTGRPKFLDESSGGHFKGRDPTVSVARLQQEWVDGTRVLYVGNAGCLQSRIKQLIGFGYGKPVGHWGGRLLWQLAGRERLLVAWRETPGEDPAEVESRMLTAFSAEFHRRPFANLVG